MTDCKGLFGKIFGHKFKKNLVFECPKTNLNLENATFSQAIKIMDAGKEKRYEIRCKRCGAKPKDEK